MLRFYLNRLGNLLRVALGVCLAFVAVDGCLVDPDQRCGAHQVLQGELCACEAGYGLVDRECVICGENEQGSLEGCECAAGFMRPT